MREDVRNFLETNAQLLDNDPQEFFHSAYNGLSIPAQTELVSLLKEADIDIEESSENFIRYIITRVFEDIDRPCSLEILIDRHLEGILGFDADWLFDYILDNRKEWDNKIQLVGAIWRIFPAEDSL